ncbi:eukaryotic translation initiation factor 5B [Culicoides brevitarsis]|uniref:eukaryotic translation initiation factor 5B n=1 Tax=Culicoides brevitarsis TaxID=469753 RepID=UPI00307B4BDD
MGKSKKTKTDQVEAVEQSENIEIEKNSVKLEKSKVLIEIKAKPNQPSRSLVEDEGEDEDNYIAPAKSAFALLDIESGADESDDVEESPKVVSKKAIGTKKPIDAQKVNKKLNKKKEKKATKEEDDDLDRMIAELKLEYNEPNAMSNKKDKKAKSKQAEVTKVESTLTNKSTKASEKENDGKVKDDVKKEQELAGDGKKKKGPNKAMVAIMQERLKLVKEEEERLKKEEEEKLRAEEEAERVRAEKKRVEAEKKEKKKLKDKERKERLKAEGKLLSDKQKREKARAAAMIESLKAQGLDLPEIGEKRTRPGTRVRLSKSKKNDLQEKCLSSEISENKDSKITNQTELHQLNKIPVEETVKDSWDADSESEDDFVKVETPLINDEEKCEGEEQSEESDGSDSDMESKEESESEEESKEDGKSHAEAARERALARIKKRATEAENSRSLDNLRAAIVCVLGHVDTGKTKILDKLRRTNVQDGEAGGITQQIGATNVPIENIKEQTKFVHDFIKMDFKLPGLLIIDTPGHESFSNLRSRGSSLCDIAILVVDIMHGLEPQTIESINLLKQRKTPFVVALNKIDRLYDWETYNRKDIRDIIKSQGTNTQQEFQKRTNDIIVQFAEQGLNASLFYNNPDPKSYISLVPTSAVTGEGMGNLLFLICQFCQSQLPKRLMFSEALQASVLEVKAVAGLGTTIDVILVNGRLREGQTMILAGTEGPIQTQIKALLMPQPMKELRVKNAFLEHKEVMAAQGVKIAAKELEKAIAGLNLQIAQKPDEVEIYKEIVAKDLRSVLSSIKLSDRGVFVQASTLGSLEALLQFLKDSKIPYSGIRIGPVVKKDVMKASIMLEHDSQYATILAFDVKIERDAQDLADHLGVKIFQADIIYHLFDKFTAYREELKLRKKNEFKHIAVFPCKLKILPQFIFNSRDPIVMGVMVEAGIVREGTPICVPSKDFIDIGVITSVECNHKQIDYARKGQEVCIKIESTGDAPKMYGRHFDETDMLVSKISRQSIDACKDYFRDELLKSDWALMVELKKTFQIL